MAHLIAGVGPFGFWGLSSTFDALEALLNHRKSSPHGIIKVLLVNPSDIRHILSTISRKNRYGEDVIIEFYLLETPVEVIARDILLLEILNDFDVPLRQRANTFLEVYGNCKVQERTSSYVEQLGSDLRNLVSSGRGRLGGIIDLGLLKYREKDELEDCFKSYSPSSFPFDIQAYRDHRMRGYYAERFDHRLALADWDYYESIKSRASIIHIKQFKDWRNNGIAFEFGDQIYTHPNRTMMSYAEGVMKSGKDKGIKKEVKGFWGDIINPPYYSFGVDLLVDPEALSLPFEKGLFDILNKNTGTEQHRHHTVEVGVYNILSALWEIETSQNYLMTKEHDIFSGLGQDSGTKVNSSLAIIEELPDEFETAAAEPVAQDDEVLTRRVMAITSNLSNIKVFPVLGSLTEKFNKPKFQDFFDLIFVSSRSAHVINEDFFGSMLKSSSPDGATGGVLAVETSKFFIPLPKTEQKMEYITKVDSYALKHSLTRISPPVPRRHRDELDKEDDVVFYARA